LILFHAFCTCALGFCLVLKVLHRLSHTFLARKLQDPAGFLHWFHTVLRIQRPEIICAPRPLSAGPEALANVQEDLLQALRLDPEQPRALAIFVDEAGYMVSMCRMVIVVTYLFGDFGMPRAGVMTPSLYICLCASTHTFTLASYFTFIVHLCRQLPMSASKRGSKRARQSAVSWSSYVQSFAIRSICTWSTALCCLVLTHSSVYFMMSTCKFVCIWLHSVWHTILTSCRSILTS